MLKLVQYIALTVIALFFIVAAVPKLGNPGAFAEMISHYQILPGNLINLAAIYLPWVEIFAAISLFSIATRKAGLSLICIMLVVFIVAQSIALAKGLDIACGCFSVSEDSKKAGLSGIVRNIFLLILTIPHFFPLPESSSARSS